MLSHRFKMHSSYSCYHKLKDIEIILGRSCFQAVLYSVTIVCSISISFLRMFEFARTRDCRMIWACPMESWIRKIGCAWPVLWCEKSGFRSGARANPHPPAHCDRWMVRDQETVFCWVLVFLRLAQWGLIFFYCLMLCGLLVLVSLPIFMFICKLEFAFALEEGMWINVHIIEKCLGFRCLCGE